jgi:pantothenate kinase-related protein Tda10
MSGFYLIGAAEDGRAPTEELSGYPVKWLLFDGWAVVMPAQPLMVAV